MKKIQKEQKTCTGFQAPVVLHETHMGFWATCGIT